MTSETDVRQALERIAGAAGEPDRLRAQVTARIRTHRQRRALLISAGSAVGAAAVGVPAFLWLHREPRSFPVGEGTSVPLHVRPTWLPDGVLSYSRQVAHPSAIPESQFFGSPEAIAARPGSTGAGSLTGQSLSVGVVDTTTLDPSSQPGVLVEEPNTDVNGVPAFIGAGSGVADVEQVTWRLADGLVGSVTGFGWATQTREIVLRVARGLVSDGLTSAAVAMRFGAVLPSVPNEPEGVSVSGSPAAWIQTLQKGLVTAQLTPADPNRGAFSERVTARGRPGTLSRAGAYQPAQLLVHLDDGRWLYLLYQPFSSDADGGDEIIQIAETMVIGPNPDLNWLGRGV
jgi:hypothetical protein